MGSFHTAHSYKDPLSPLDLIGVVWELYGRLATCYLSSWSGLRLDTFTLCLAYFWGPGNVVWDVVLRIPMIRDSTEYPEAT